jgi:Holliday junction resolvase RusA-like endonuclease
VKPLLEFVVSERPRPKGSLTVVSKTYVKESIDPEGVFRTAVARAAWSAATGRIPSGVKSYRDLHAPGLRSALRPFEGPIETRMLFRFARKRGHKLWAPADPLDESNRHLGVGDIEKLVRNVHDALTDSGVIADDHQISALGRVEKRFCDEDLFQTPGCYVSLWPDNEGSDFDDVDW